MTDYQPLIARAVEGLEKSTGEARRSLYERARTALVTQLRAVDPPLSESDITKERLALEDAIRRVEAEAARKSRVEVREPRQAAPPPPPRAERPPTETGRVEARHPEPPVETDAAAAKVNEAPPRPAAPPPPTSARERLLGARSPNSLSREGIRGFRDVVGEVHDLGGAAAKAAKSARDTRDSYRPISSRRGPGLDEATTAPPHDEFEPAFDTEEAGAFGEAEHAHGHELGYGHEDHGAALSPRQPRHGPEDEHHAPRPPRSYRWLVQLAIALIIFAGLAATISWQWPHIASLYSSITQLGSRQQNQAARDTNGQQKFPGRVPQEGGGQTAGGTVGGQTAPAVAQRVVLYEEDSNDPQGKRYVGSAIWRTETVSPGPGLAPELAVRADVEIPERRITMTWSIRRNTDQALPASHTIEIMFNLPADFAGGGIANVPGILMKQSEQARGTPLAGLAVKVTNGFFLIGLSAVDTDVQRNVQLIKERPWFDIPIVYTNGGRAILAMEKGPPGDRAFADAFAAWEKK
jgi:hypothetical protein